MALASGHAWLIFLILPLLCLGQQGQRPPIQPGQGPPFQPVQGQVGQRPPFQPGQGPPFQQVQGQPGQGPPFPQLQGQPGQGPPFPQFQGQPGQGPPFQQVQGPNSQVPPGQGQPPQGQFPPFVVPPPFTPPGAPVPSRFPLQPPTDSLSIPSELPSGFPNGSSFTNSQVRLPIPLSSLVNLGSQVNLQGLTMFRTWEIMADILITIPERDHFDFLLALQPNLLKGLPSPRMADALRSNLSAQILRVLVTQSSGMLPSQKSMLARRMKRQFKDPGAFTMILGSEAPWELVSFYNSRILESNMPVFLQAIQDFTASRWDINILKVRLLPPSFLSTMLKSQLGGNPLSIQQLRGRGELTALTLMGITCQQIKTLRHDELVPFIQMFRTQLYANRKQVNNLNFPINIRNCVLDGLLSHLATKPEDNGVNVLSRLSLEEIEAVGGEILSGIPIEDLTNLPAELRREILVEIGHLENFDLLHLIPIGKLGKFANLLLNDLSTSFDPNGSPNLPGTQQLLKLGSLFCYADLLNGNSTKESIRQMLEFKAAPGTKACCLDEASQGRWTIVLKKVFGTDPSSWTGQDLTVIGDMLVALSVDDIEKLSVIEIGRRISPLLENSGLNFPIHGPGRVEPMPFARACTNLLQNSTGIVNSFKALMRKYVLGAELMVNFIQKTERKMNARRVARDVTEFNEDDHHHHLLSSRDIMFQQERYSRANNMPRERRQVPPMVPPSGRVMPPSANGPPQGQNPAAFQPRLPQTMASQLGRTAPMQPRIPSQNRQFPVQQQQFPMQQQQFPVQQQQFPMQQQQFPVQQQQFPMQQQQFPVQQQQFPMQQQQFPVQQQQLPKQQQQFPVQQQQFPMQQQQQFQTNPQQPQIPPTSNLQQPASNHQQLQTTIPSNQPLQHQSATQVPTPAHQHNAHSSSTAPKSGTTTSQHARSLPSDFEIKLSCLGIKAAGPAAIGLTLNDFASLDPSELRDCIEAIGFIDWGEGMKRDLLLTYKQKLNLTTDTLTTLNLIELGSLVSGLSVAGEASKGTGVFSATDAGGRSRFHPFDISAINLAIPANLDTVSILGTQISNADMLKVIGHKFSRDNNLANPEGGKRNLASVSTTMWALGNILCGLDETNLKTILDSVPEVFMEVSTMLGRLQGCDAETLSILANYAVQSNNYGAPETWSVDDVNTIGVMVAGLTPAALGSISPLAMEGLQPRSAKAFSPVQLQALTPDHLVHLTYETAKEIRDHGSRGLTTDQAGALQDVLVVNLQQLKTSPSSSGDSNGGMDDIHARSIEEEDRHYGNKKLNNDSISTNGAVDIHTRSTEGDGVHHGNETVTNDTISTNATVKSSEFVPDEEDVVVIIAEPTNDPGVKGHAHGELDPRSVSDPLHNGTRTTTTTTTTTSTESPTHIESTADSSSGSELHFISTSILFITIINCMIFNR